MGCESSSDQRVQTLEEQFAAAGLNSLVKDAKFNVEFERQIFMAINLCRFAPARFEQVVQEVKQTNRQAQAVQGTVQLRKHMRQMQKLPPVSFNEKASSACRENNDRVCQLADVVNGGNLELYNKALGRVAVGEDYTHRSFNSTSGAEFVALQLILNWGRKGPGEGKSPILDKSVTSVGICMGSSQAFQNITQVLYVKGVPKAKQTAVQPVAPVMAV